MASTAHVLFLALGSRTGPEMDVMRGSRLLIIIVRCFLITGVLLVKLRTWKKNYSSNRVTSHAILFMVVSHMQRTINVLFKLKNLFGL